MKEQLKSIIDQLKTDKKIEKAYLDGRYGGVPVFDSIFFPNDDIE